MGWLLWLICLPIIPAVAIAVWYIHDPEGFKKSPYAKALIALFFVWAASFGFVATNKPQLDANGKYSPIQASPNGEVSGKDNGLNTASPAAAKEKLLTRQSTKPTYGRRLKTVLLPLKPASLTLSAPTQPTRTS